MISKREILNVVQAKLESLELFQTVRQPEIAFRISVCSNSCPT